MKKLFAVICLCSATAIISCKKDSTATENISIVGSWHLFAIISSFVSHTPDDNIVLTFKPNGGYIQTNNNAVTAQGNYTINFEQRDSVNLALINYNPNLDNAPGAQVTRLNDTLVLTPEVFSTDGYVLMYKKQ